MPRFLRFVMGAALLAASGVATAQAPTYTHLRCDYQSDREARTITATYRIGGGEWRELDAETNAWGRNLCSPRDINEYGQVHNNSCRFEDDAFSLEIAGQSYRTIITINRFNGRYSVAHSENGRPNGRNLSGTCRVIPAPETSQRQF